MRFDISWTAQQRGSTLGVDAKTSRGLKLAKSIDLFLCSFGGGKQCYYYFRKRKKNLDTVIGLRGCWSSRTVLVSVVIIVFNRRYK